MTGSSVFAERRFERSEDGQGIRLVLRVPHQDDGWAPDWRCDYELVTDDGTVLTAGYAGGVDSLQAVLLALRMADADLRTGGPCTFLGQTDLGLP